MKKRILCIICIIALLMFPGCNEQAENWSETTNAGSAGNAPPPPARIDFSTVEKIQQFVSVSQTSDQAFEDYIKTLRTLVSKQEAKKAAVNIASHPFPIVTGRRVPPGRFSAVYNLTYNYFQVYYTVDNCKYKFYYDYNSTVESEYENAPVLTDVRLGDYLVDLYLKEDCLKGSFWIGTCRVSVTVYTTFPDDVNFDVFNFEYLSKISND